MIILDKECEITLKKLIDLSKSKNGNAFVVTEEILKRDVADKLNKSGYITIKQDCSDTDMFSVFIELTRDGLNYFKNKKANRWRIVKEWGKFLIPVLVSVAALIISIVI